MGKRRKKKKVSAALIAVIAILALGIACAAGFAGKKFANGEQQHNEGNNTPAVVVEGALQIHFLELGNKYTGDCTYIKAGDTDILIDAGSRTTSVSTIQSYIDRYVTDGKLEYVIVTHAHEDHYAGFSVKNGSLFDLYECGVIIDFSETNQSLPAEGKSNLYGNYLSELADEVAAGATHYTAAECITGGHDLFDLGSGITMKVLDQKYYYEKSSTENNYSVCTLFSYGDYRYLFTGDLEKDGEKSLVERNELPKVDLYKGGHHGSKTSSSNELLQVIQPKIVCVCCCCGSPEYTKTDANQFPTQEFVDRVAPYTDRVYVTTMCVDYEAGTFASMNGNITVITDSTGLRVVCSNADTLLKEWDWFKQHRVCPAAWSQ